MEQLKLFTCKAARWSDYFGLTLIAAHNIEEAKEFIKGDDDAFMFKPEDVEELKGAFIENTWPHIISQEYGYVSSY